MEPVIIHEEESTDTAQELTGQEKAAMKLYVSRDKKHRGGKQVTLIEGYDGPEEILETMLSKLKSHCSAGGSIKEGVVIIQGDHVNKVMAWLSAQGFKQVKRKGG